MNFDEYRTYVKSDLFRYEGVTSWRKFLRNIILSPGFKYTFILRTCRFLQGKKVLQPIYHVFRLLHRHYSIRYGIDIPSVTNIGKGFYIGHYGGIVINGYSRIGNNVNISHGVTLGQANRGHNRGCPSVGNQVYIGPGAKIIGKISIGNNVAIGANCVVTKDVPDDAVVIGVPAKIISDKGSRDYVNRIWRPD